MRLRTLTAALVLAGVASLAQAAEKPVDPYVVSNANAGATPVEGEQLLAAFHGQAGIARVVDRMVDLSIADPRIAEIFRATDLERLRRNPKEQVGYLLGAGVDYTGRDMKTAHKDQGINTAEFNALVENLQKAMDEEKVPFRAQNQLLAKLAPMKRDVVVR